MTFKQFSIDFADLFPIILRTSKVKIRILCVKDIQGILKCRKEAISFEKEFCECNKMPKIRERTKISSKLKPADLLIVLTCQQTDLHKSLVKSMIVKNV